MKIVAAMDHSDRDRLVVDRTVRIAEASSAEVVLLHVVGLTKSVVPGAAREAEAYLTAVRAGLVERGVDAQIEVVKGDVAAEVARYAEGVDADVVIIGTRGRRGWDRLVLGSVAEAVLASCSRPVLVVNEATYRAHTDEAIRRKSGYLAAVVWAKQASEAMTSRDAQAALRQLADQGLDEKTLFTTYEALQADGIPPEWLDLDFQLRTLREYRPAELAGLLPDASPPEADADAA